MGKIYAGDIGTVFTYNCGEDISGASGYALKVQKDDGTEVTWTGALYNSSYIRYTTIANDLDQAGAYKIQGYVEELSGWTGRGETDSFTVYEHFA